MATRLRGATLLSQGKRKTFYRDYSLSLPFNDVRLLTVKPARIGLIECNLRVVQLSKCDPDSFFPLSYAWGDPVPAPFEPATIKIDDEWFEIRDNLADALLRLRHPTQSWTYWIDAICINQEDETEKTEQLGRVPDIYSYASTTVIWIGEESTSSNIAIDHFNQVHDFSWNELRVREDIEKYPEPWKYLFTDLVIRPWFQRLWVVQEVVTSRNSLMVCGSRQIPWEIFRSVLATATNLVGPDSPISENDVSQLMQNNIRAANAMGLSHQRQLDRVPTLLLIWIRIFGSQLCSDRKDAILALRALASDRDEPMIQRLGYHNTAEEIFTIATQHILSRPEDIDHLSTQLYHPDGSLKLPSWVPDYASRKPSLFSFDKGTFAPDEDSFDASARYLTRRYSRSWFGPLRSVSSITAYVPKFEKVGSHDLMTVDGLIVNTLVNLSTTALTYAGNTKKVANFSEFLTDVVLTVFGYGSPSLKELDPYPAFENSIPSGHTYSSALWTALQFGLKPNEQNRFSDEIVRATIAAAHQLPWNSVRADRLVGYHVALVGDRRYIAVVPQSALRGDVVCIVFGCSVPLIMRRVPNIPQERYILIGASYVHGIMDGEALGGPAVTGLTQQRITVQ